MAKTKYYGVKVGKQIGVFNNWKQASLYVNGYKGAEFKVFSNEQSAYSYVGLPYLIHKYRKLQNDKDRIRFVSSLNTKDKNILYSNMCIEEINHYKKIASDLMERRFNAVKKEKELLDYLTVNPKAVQYSILNSKYANVDLSIAIYTIKAIINVMGESDFSKDDGSSYSNPNAQKYYNICKKYWDNIWWDTDTGVLSKDAIENKQFSEYHKNCNKIKTIAKIRKYLHQLKIISFNKKYSILDLEQNYEYYKQIQLAKEEERKFHAEMRRRKQEELKRIKREEEQKLQKEQEQLNKNKIIFYNNLNNTFLENNSTFDNYAKSLHYNIEQQDLILYRTVAIDKSVTSVLTDRHILKFKEQALNTIQVHSGTEYNKPFILEAVNVLRNLIF